MIGYRCEPLDVRHVLDNFDSSASQLDAWLRHDALRAQQQGTARAFVSAEQGRGTGYFALAPTSLRRSEVPSRAAGGNSVVSGFLIARRAVDRSCQGHGLGSRLLIEAISRVCDGAQAAGGRLIVVDAIDEAAASFCRKHDFVPIAGTRRLYLKIATAIQALGR